jgi:hypothetical protein
MLKVQSGVYGRVTCESGGGKGDRNRVKGETSIREVMVLAVQISYHSAANLEVVD